MTTKESIWQEWTGRYVDTENPTSLFETKQNLTVGYKVYGKNKSRVENNRRILKRSERMEGLLQEEEQKVVKDWSESDDRYDGLVYMTYWLENETVVPLYVGKCGKYGNNENLNNNLHEFKRNRDSTNMFARWGDGHDYHIGDLSNVIFDHDKNQKQKYEKWADRLFEEGRQLRQQTYFWAKAWQQEDIGLYHDFEEPLEQLEYQIIGLVSDLYPDRLLNDEGA